MTVHTTCPSYASTVNFFFVKYMFLELMIYQGRPDSLTVVNLRSDMTKSEAKEVNRLTGSKLTVVSGADVLDLLAASPTSQ